MCGISAVLAEVTPKYDFRNAHPCTQNVGIAFVTFKSTSAAERCLEDPRVTGTWLDWRVSPAPPPCDILWHNIAVSTVREPFIRSMPARSPAEGHYYPRAKNILSGGAHCTMDRREYSSGCSVNCTE